MLLPLHIYDYWWILPVLLVAGVVALLAWLRAPSPLERDVREQRPAGGP